MGTKGHQRSRIGTKVPEKFPDYVRVPFSCRDRPRHPNFTSGATKKAAAIRAPLAGRRQDVGREDEGLDDRGHHFELHRRLERSTRCLARLNNCKDVTLLSARPITSFAHFWDCGSPSLAGKSSLPRDGAWQRRFLPPHEAFHYYGGKL